MQYFSERRKCMRKALSWLVTIVMIASILRVGFIPTPAQGAENTNGTFISVRFVPVGFDRDGEELVGKDFPWQKAGEQVWGRTGYNMPDSLKAFGLWTYTNTANDTTLQISDINIPATTTERSAFPVLWTDFYLTVNPAGGRSQESEHWYAVYDNIGQLWLDPDGRFNDPRYFEPADPTNLNDKYISESCKNNPLARVDPSTGNNTQGPYILDQENPRFNATVDDDGNTVIYFWDKNRTQRIFRLGWVDMVDFPLHNDGDGNLIATEVQGIELENAVDVGVYDWDASGGTKVDDATSSNVRGYELVDFRYWGTPNEVVAPLSGGNAQVTDYATAALKTYNWFYNSVNATSLTLTIPTRAPLNLSPNRTNIKVCVGDELHTGSDTASLAADKITEIAPWNPGTYWANVAQYNPGEFIYRKGFGFDDVPGSNNEEYFVQTGDIRLTNVSVFRNGETRNYPANSLVKATDWDWNKMLYRFPVNFDEEGQRVAAANDEVHVDNRKIPADFYWQELWNSYEYGEWIYREVGMDTASHGFVTVGDYRLTNVNGMVNLGTMKKDKHRGWINADVDLVPSENMNGELVPRVFGDGLVLAEVLFGGCNAPAYNLSVETDMWEGMVPSTTAAAIRSPNDDVKPAAQTVQKNTVLDPTGANFNIPATTFHNVNLKYREYIGVQIWKDDGVDNHLGINYPNNPPPPVDTLYPYNLSDDYRAGRTGEEYIGASNGMYAEKDFGRNLLPFPDDIMFYDTALIEGNEDGLYGCGEAIYKDIDGSRAVSEGDKRLTDVTVTIGNNVIKYKADTTVAVGDADAGLDLTNFHAFNLFFDKNWPAKDIPFNWTYDVGEEIYSLPITDVEPDGLYETNLGYLGNNYNFYMGIQELDDGGVYVNMYENVLYMDVDASGSATPGDIRIYDGTGKWGHGSILNWKDVDCLGNWSFINPPAPTAYEIIARMVDNALALYVDVNHDSLVNTGDIRLTKIKSYLPYTIVKATDTDVSPVDPDTAVAIATSRVTLFDTTYRNVIVWDASYTWDGTTLTINPPDPNPEINDGDKWITPYSLRNGDTRLTNVTISDVTYVCGSVLGEKMDMWINENPIYGLSMGKNSNFRFIDWEVYPSSKIGMNVKIDKPFKVEQTSQIDVTVDPAPRPARWVDGVYYPPEKVYILVQNTEGPVPEKIYEDYKVITAENPIATFQFTPYRGTCPSNGQSAGWRKTTVNGINGFVLQDYDNRVRIIAIKEDGGVAEPAPKTYSFTNGKISALPIIDPFWVMHTNLNKRWGQAKGNVAFNPPRYQVPPFTEEMMNTFDCFAQTRYEIAPEDIDFVSNKKCLGVLDQRFPNLTIKLTDANNPNDVNDPNGLRISVPAGEGQNVGVMYNAHNAGIDYLFTAAGLDQFGNPDFEERFIVQVNLDGTYLYWHWEDNYPQGLFDASDELYSPVALCGNDRIPNYTESKERPNFIDADCSLGTGNCTVCGDGFPELSKISYGDKFANFYVISYGVPAYLMNYGVRSATDDGGELQLAIAPRDAATKLQLRIYTFNVLFDYNSTIKHPPYFIIDKNIPSFNTDFIHETGNYMTGLRTYETMGIDYCGIKEFKVLPPDPYVNFVELSIVDHALQNSRVNYTTGPSALSPLNVPTPQIQAPYQPMILDVGKDMRGYPGGQTHTGRVQGVVTAGGVTRTDQDHNGWNAYPAVWWWYWYDNVDYNNFTDFNRLGTEFFPLTDYGMYFILKDIDGKHLGFGDRFPIDQRLRRVEVKGPFARPKLFDEANIKYESDYEYNGLRHVPISYDWDGIVAIDPSNDEEEGYFYQCGQDWTNVDLEGASYAQVNEILNDNHQLDYRGLTDVFRFEEFIPISYGRVNVTVTLWDGTVKIFQDCCAEPPTDGVDVHALEVTADVDTVTADTDNKITITVKEHEAMQAVQPANDAYVYAWQDRGILNPRTNLYDGAGDGWITNPPHSSDFSALSPQYFTEDDLNEDGKIAFSDYETEIIGSYDLATNTWTGGVVDARTFQRNNGQYIFDFSESNGARINTVGLDFGGAKGDPDHVVSEFETLPIMITAYKYGDDNNDRSFRPLYSFPGTTPQYSHEVYLSGQKFIEVAPLMDLSVSVQPNPLTAGVTPELVDPVSPLSFVLTNEEGNPVDLSRGVADYVGKSLVETDDIWNHLFKDSHPDPLPEYYWLRTDLHNDDSSRISNRKLYSTSAAPFQPITVDFSMAKDGKYAFRGFCANDEGSFDVFIYTPDRKHAAKATVNVVLPTAEWAIVNTEDPAGNEFQVPGEPDFALTAADCRLYRLRVTAKNAQGLLLKGVTKGVSTCGGGIKNTARFTTYSTRPGSFDFTEKDRYLFAEHFLQDLYPYTLNIGYDFNDNGKIDWRNAELFSLSAFTHKQNRDDQLTLGQVYYNTTLIRYDEESIKGGWDITPNPNLVPPTTGWGLGAIYNSAHKGGYLFADIDGDKKLTYHDSLGLDVNAQTTFYIFAEDLAYIGGLIGDNVYCNNPVQSDLAGYPPSYKTDPEKVYKRFVPELTPDGVFFLDWEAFPNKEVEIKAPQLRVLNAQTRADLNKDLVNAANYDLVYATENHMIVQVRPADTRDVPMKEDGRVFLIGNQHQTAIYGHTKQSPTDPKVMETTLHFTPTGLGENVASLGYFNKNCFYLKAPYELKNTSTYTLRELLQLDSVIGLKVEVVSDDMLHPNKTSTITAKVTEIGTNAPVEGANVTVKGPGVNASKKTDKAGLATFDVTPNDKGIITVTATMDGKIIGTAEIRVVSDTSAPWIELDPLQPFTNKPQAEVTGRTNPGNTVTLNGSPAQVAQDGSFKGNVTLKEGLNTIVGEAKNPAGLTVRKMVTITLDTVPPNIFIDDPGYLVDETEIELTGRVEPDSKVTVNGQPATVVHDIWKVMVKVNHGKNAVTVVAVDQAGNSNTATRDILVYKRLNIKLTIDNIVPTINGTAQNPLEAAPFIAGGRTMVPIRFIAEAFNAKVDWDEATKGITITLGNTVIAMQVGNTTAMINGKAITLDAPPVIRAGRTFVPIRFISEAFNAQVLWDESTRTVTIIYDYLP